MTDPSAPALRVAGVTKSFERTPVLQGVDLELPPAAIAAVLGPSGCGKTTLLRIIAGFERLDAGEVDVAAVRVAGPGTDVTPERRRVGIVPQEGALFPHLDVARNVGFGLPRGAAASARIDEMLDLVGLSGRGSTRPDHLSGGQQQRVALARALAPSPSLILLDEPFSSLDAGLRGQVRDEVFDVLRRAGATAVLVTHDQHEALSIADHVAVLLDGRVAQAGTPAEIYEQPATAAVARFVGDANVLVGRATDTGAACALGTMAIRTTVRPGAVDIVVRPEQILLTAPSTAEVLGTVVGRSYFGHDGVARIQLAGGELVRVRCGAAGLPHRGDLVGVEVVGPVSAFAC